MKQPPKKILEKDIQAAILQYLSLRKILAWRNNTGAGFNSNSNGKQYFIRFSFKGAPDIMGILPGGKFLGIEVKKPGGKLSPDQEVFMATVATLGGVGFMASSIEDVTDKLKAYGF